MRSKGRWPPPRQGARLPRSASFRAAHRDRPEARLAASGDHELQGLAVTSLKVVPQGFVNAARARSRCAPATGESGGPPRGARWGCCRRSCRGRSAGRATGGAARRTAAVPDRPGATHARWVAPRRLSRAHGCGDADGETRRRWEPRRAAAGEAPPKGLAQPREQLRCDQGMATEVEEVTGPADVRVRRAAAPKARRSPLPGEMKPVRSSGRVLSPSSGAGRAFRSSLPLGVSGRSASSTTEAGSIGSGTLSPQELSQLPGTGLPAALPHHVGDEPSLSRLVVAQEDAESWTAGCWRRCDSISESSTRKPRIFTCWSARPRNSRSPEGR